LSLKNMCCTPISKIIDIKNKKFELKIRTYSSILGGGFVFVSGTGFVYGTDRIRLTRK